MAAVLALLSAIGYGAGDFLGGLASRRLPAVGVVARTHVIGLAGLAVALPLAGGDPASGRDLLAGSAGGIAGGVGIFLLYAALGAGVMSVVAPITAVLSAAVPLAAGLALGERPGALALFGVVPALGAVVLLSRDPDGSGPERALTPKVLAMALGAGLGFGLFFVAIGTVEDGVGLGPLVAARGTSAVLFVAAAMRWRTPPEGRSHWRSASTVWILIGCGVLDVGSNVAYFEASQRGLLSLVSVLSALYPAATVLLARTFLGERLARPQLLGVVLAAGSVALLAS